MTILNIVAVDKPAPQKTGEIRGLFMFDITNKLGFEPNVEDDPTKVTASWGFKVNPDAKGRAHVCGIWDYRGSGAQRVWSTYGPDGIFRQIFGDAYYDVDEMMKDI